MIYFQIQTKHDIEAWMNKADENVDYLPSNQFASHLLTDQPVEEIATGDDEIDIWLKKVG